MTRAASLLAVALLLAGCGSASHPRFEHDDAAGLIALAGRIAAEGPCAQSSDITKLHAHAVALVNARRVPRALQEPLMSAVNALTAERPLCLPTVPASTTTSTITVPAPHGPKHGPKPGPKHGPPGPGDHHGHDHGHGHGHGGDG